MNNYDEIQFEERNEYAAVTWGVIYGLYSVFLTFFLRIESSVITNPAEVFIEGTLTLQALLYILNWILRISVTIWIIRIAKRLNRQEIIWGIFGFLFPPITLIVIGFQDYKIADKRIEKIVEKARLDFNAELFHIKATQDVSEGEYKQLEMKVREKFKNYIKERILEISLTEKEGPAEIEEQAIVAGQNIVEVDEDELFQSIGDQVISEDINKCPACGAAISETTTVCSECGLTIK